MGSVINMDAQTLLETISDQGIVAVLRSRSVEQALEVARACLLGTVRSIEVTFSVPQADEAIAALVREGDAVVGAGTVLTIEQAQLAHAAGAAFIVGPNFDPQIARFCAEVEVPYIPGCMTVNEMLAANKAGCEVVKLFPSNQFDPSFLEAIHAPLPELKIMPTGGIDLDNTASWIAAGAFAVGVGGNLTKVIDGDYGRITRAARDYREQISIGRR